MDPWVMPAVTGTLAAVKNRELILKAWDKVIATIAGREYTIAVVGEAGVGKSVLADFLVGDAYDRDYKSPGQSENIEKETTKHQKERLIFRIVPGQPIHADRFHDLSKTIAGKKPVDGIICVVSDGLHELRKLSAESLAQQAGVSTLEELREVRREAELADLKNALALLRPYLREHRKPAWLIMAVTKADLFSDDAALVQVQKRYLDSNSGFQKAMDDFRNGVGRDNFTWTALPVAAALEDYHFRTEMAKSSLLPGQRDKLVLELLDTIGRLCRAANG